MVFSDEDDCKVAVEYTANVIQSKGYSLEIHYVTTEDGYINTLYRVSSKNIKIEKSKYPILVVNGLLSSAAESVLEDNHLGYYLVDNGFDVWVANWRGTLYSRGHLKYHHINDAKKYWDFSFHELGYYDNPAFIDYILLSTGFSKLTYIGISQGTTSFVVLMSTRPEYNEKIAVGCLLTPSIKFRHGAWIPTKLIYGYFFACIWWLSEFLNIPVNIPSWCKDARKFGARFAKPNTYFGKILRIILDIAAGYPNHEFNRNVDLSKYSSTGPNSASVKQFMHYSQVIIGNKFRQYDYGTKKNLEVYSSASPPSYDLSKVIAPVALFYSKNDCMNGPQDIEEISEELGNCVYKYMVEHDKFNHLNYIYCEDVIPLLYSHVVNFIVSFTE